jgi:hypothetical protein
MTTFIQKNQRVTQMLGQRVPPCRGTDGVVFDFNVLDCNADDLRQQRDLAIAAAVNYREEARDEKARGKTVCGNRMFQLARSAEADVEWYDEMSQLLASWNSVVKLGDADFHEDRNIISAMAEQLRITDEGSPFMERQAS